MPNVFLHLLCLPKLHYIAPRSFIEGPNSIQLSSIHAVAMWDRSMATNFPYFEKDFVTISSLMQDTACTSLDQLHQY